MKANPSVDEKMTATSANAGLRAGSLAGFAMGLYAFTTILLFKSRVLEQLAAAKEKLAPFMPAMDLNTFYLLGLFAAPVAMVLVFLVIGVLFATVFDRVNTRPRLKAALFALLFIFGCFLGLTTNLPVNRVITLAASLCCCLLFAFLFLSRLKWGKGEEIGALEKKGKVALFLVLVAVFTLSLWGLSSLLDTRLIILSPFYMFVPFAATILTCLLSRVPLGSLALLAKPNKWFLVAWLLPMLLSIATLGVSTLLPGVNYSPSMEGVSRYTNVSPSLAVQQYAFLGLPPIICVVFLSLIAGPTVNALFAFGEEIGWRGFLYHELRHVGFWKLSYATGFIWGIWHTPLILHGLNYPQHPVEGVAMMIVFTVLLSPLMLYIRIRTKSVIGAAIMHGTVNAASGISIAFAEGGSDLVVGLTGVSGFIVLALANAVLFKAARLPAEELSER